MPWDKNIIAKYPRLTDQSIAGQRLLRIARNALLSRRVEANWEEVNPEMRDWWVSVVADVLKVARTGL